LLQTAGSEVALVSFFGALVLIASTEYTGTTQLSLVESSDNGRPQIERWTMLIGVPAP